MSYSRPFYKDQVFEDLKAECLRTGRLSLLFFLLLVIHRCFNQVIYLAKVNCLLITDFRLVIHQLILNTAVRKKKSNGFELKNCLLTHNSLSMALAKMILTKV